MDYTILQTRACAQAAHEANRAYCRTLGDQSQPAWDDAPDWQQTSAINGVHGVINGNTPEQSHESWLKEKLETGWKYGPVKDPEKKEHPCFVPYAELPPEQKAKDGIFVGVVNVMLLVFGRAA
jgi:RyR domain